MCESFSLVERWQNPAERDTRKRLLINRHIAKMTPEEIARRFTVYLALEAAEVRQNRRKAASKPVRVFLAMMDGVQMCFKFFPGLWQFRHMRQSFGMCGM